MPDATSYRARGGRASVGYALAAGLVAASALGLLVYAGRGISSPTAPTSGHQASSTLNGGVNKSYTLRLYTDSLIARRIDEPPAGYGPGDEEVLRIRLHSDRSVAEGRMNVTCTVQSVLTDAPVNCYGYIRLSSGKILVAGKDSPNYPTVRFRVVGGTGVYHNATGVMVGHPTTDAAVVDIELTHTQSG